MTIERSDPPLRDDEAATVLGFLDYHRNTLRMKTEGLSQEQLDATLAPGEMTLGGMLKHLALVEDYWFSVVLMGNPDAEPWLGVDWDADRDWEWHSAKNDAPDQLRGLLDKAIAASDRLVAEALGDGGLDTLSAKGSRQDNDQKFSLRWILLHMIEEYARHNGHADLIRESIDGQTGE
ncbi:MAG: DinB family protein [Nocardioides sp.]